MGTAAPTRAVLAKKAQAAARHRLCEMDQRVREMSTFMISLVPP